MFSKLSPKKNWERKVKRKDSIQRVFQFAECLLLVTRANFVFLKASKAFKVIGCHVPHF